MNSTVWSLGQLTENTVHDMKKYRLSAVRGFAVFVKRLEVLFDRRQRQETNHFLKAVEIIYIVFYVHLLFFLPVLILSFLLAGEARRVGRQFGHFS